MLPAATPPTEPQAPAAPGQPIFAGETVMERPRPEFDPIGLRAGDFFWFPRAEADETYNNNIFATPSPTSSDLITTLQPSFDLLSSFPSNALNLHGGAAFQNYAEHPAQDTEDGFGAIDGRLDVTAGNWLYGGAQVAHLHLPRTSPDSPGNAAEPVTYNDYTVNAGYTQTRLRLGYQAELAVHGEGYNAVPLIGGGILPQDAQNLTVSQAALRISYEWVPDYVGYARFAANLREYEHVLPGSVRFNSTGYRGDFGLQILPRHIIYGDIYAGYLSQIYSASSFGSISGLDAGGRLVWNLTRLTTVTFTGLRAVNTSNPSIGITGVGYLASAVTVDVSHELLRNLLLSATAGYENDAFQGVSRTDNISSAGASVKYLLNRNLYLGTSFQYQQRNSSGTAVGTPYAQSILMVRLITQF
ncbi:MAG: outer membrane beta-barrel protein [Xanthobacteraceae bacterium]